QTRNLKVARDLAELVVGQVESGLFQDEVQSGSGMQGTFSEQGYPEFSYEIVLGDDTFNEPDKTTGAFDTWKKKDEKKKEQVDEQDQAEQPYEKVKVRVTFPKLEEFTNQVTLEQWLPWKQVHVDKDAAKSTSSTGSSNS